LAVTICVVEATKTKVLALAEMEVGLNLSRVFI